MLTCGVKIGKTVYMSPDSPVLNTEVAVNLVWYLVDLCLVVEWYGI